mgnify:CR=1 FL=1
MKSLVDHLQSHKTAIPDVQSHIIANMLCGLKSKNDSCPEVSNLLKWLHNVIASHNAAAGATPKHSSQWKSSDIALALYGLQDMGSQGPSHTLDARHDRKIRAPTTTNMSEEILNVLAELNTAFLKSTCTLHCKDVGKAMYSLNNMSDDYEEVRQVIHTLTGKLRKQRLEDGKKYRNSVPDLIIAKALYGLRSMTSDSAEVRGMITELADMLEVEGQGDMNLQSISMAFMGISNLNSKHVEVQALLNVLSQRLVLACQRETLYSQAVGNILYSLNVYKETSQFEKSTSNIVVREEEIRSRTLILQTILRNLTAVKARSVYLEGLAVRGALRGLGLFPLHMPEVPLLLDVILQKSVRINSHSTHGFASRNSATFPPHLFHPEHVAGALSSFQNVDSNNPIVKNWLDFLSETLIVGVPISPPSVSYIVSAYRGLMNMDSQCASVRNVLKSLYMTINSFSSEKNSAANVDSTAWRSIDIALIINSLQNMKSFHAEVRNTLQALLVKVDVDDTLHFSPNEMSLALYGMRGMSTMHSEVGSTLNLLHNGIINFQEGACDISENFTPRSATTSLYGLQNMSSSSVEVKSILKVLERLISGCEDSFNNNEIGSAYFGLQSMDIYDEEVARILTVINDKLESMEESLNARTISDVLFGLPRCSISAHPQVSRSIQLICSRDTFPSSTSTHSFDDLEFSLDEVSRAIYGLMCMIRSESTLQHSEISMLEKLLSEAHRNVKLSIAKSDWLTQRGLLSMCRSISLLSHTAVGLPPSLDESLRVLVNTIESIEIVSMGDRGAQESSTEKRFAAVAQQLMTVQGKSDLRNISVETSVFIHGFSCDILFKSLSSPNFCCNIELDGPTHKLTRKNLMCELRDSFLKSRGIHVIRIDLSDHPDHDDDMITRILKSRLSEIPILNMD